MMVKIDEYELFLLEIAASHARNQLDNHGESKVHAHEQEGACGDKERQRLN